MKNIFTGCKVWILFRHTFPIWGGGGLNFEIGRIFNETELAIIFQFMKVCPQPS